MEQQISMIKRAQAGDEAAFTWLYEKSKQYIHKHCIHLGANDADAQDVTQEVMIRVYKYIHNLKDPQCYQSWLTKIINNTYHNHYRKKSRYVLLPEEFDIQEERDYMLPDTCVTTLEQINQIKTAMDPLRDKLQEVLILYYLKEMSEKEIAKTINRPLGTVKSRLYAARVKMRNERVYT